MRARADERHVTRMRCMDCSSHLLRSSARSVTLMAKRLRSSASQTCSHTKQAAVSVDTYKSCVDATDLVSCTHCPIAPSKPISGM